MSPKQPPPKYWIEEIGQAGPVEDSMLEAVISCKEHGACIRVYGEGPELTSVVVKVLTGLNGSMELPDGQ
jgi:hypothetical protein